MARKSKKTMSKDFLKIVDIPELDKEVSLNGALRDIIDGRDNKYRFKRPIMKALGLSNPKSSDWRFCMPPIKDQGPDGACVGFTCVAFIESMLNRDKNIVKDLSEEMAYNYAKKYDEWPGDNYVGTSIRGCLKAINKHGVCEEEYWKYSASISTKPKNGYESNAGKYKVKAYRAVNVNEGKLHYLKCALEQCPVMGGFTLSETFQTPDSKGFIADGPIDENLGHAMLIVGWQSEGDYFILRNSWGPRWGDRGYAYVSSNLISKMIFSAWIAELY